MKQVLLEEPHLRQGLDSASPFGWCFAGTGAIARSAAKAVTPGGRHRVVSVCSRSFANAQAFAARFGGVPRETLDAALAESGVECVYIATPHVSHYALAKTALEHGKNVLIEKPFTVTRTQAAELFALAERHGVYLAEAMWTWFSPVTRQVAQWVREGVVGSVERVEIMHGVPVIKTRQYGPRLSNPNLAGGALLDTGVYPVTYIYRLFGLPSAIRCAGVLRGGVDVSEMIGMDFPDGLHVTIPISIEKFLGETFTLTGSGGVIRHPFFHARGVATLRPKSGQAIKIQGDASLGNEFDLAAAEIRQGRTASAFVPPQATLDVMGLLDSCRAQMGLVYPFE